MSDVQAKACPVPRCGSPAHVYDDHRDGWWFVECLNDDCALTGPRHRTEAEAIAAWNKLASVEPVADGHMPDWGEFYMSARDVSDSQTAGYADEVHVGARAMADLDDVIERVSKEDARRADACIRALAGLNPDALPELVEAVEFEIKFGAPKHLADALAKLRREEA